MWTARSLTGQVLLQQRRDDVLAARELTHAPGSHLHLDLSLPLPRAVFARAGKGRRRSVMRSESCWDRTSLAEAGAATTGGTWTEGGKRLEAGLIVGWRRLCPCNPGRSRVVSHRWEHHMCTHLVTHGPSFSWPAHTSQPWAFQQELARSDLSGTHRTKVGTIWQPPGKGLGTIWQPPGKGLGTSSFHCPHEMASRVHRP